MDLIHHKLPNVFISRDRGKVYSVNLVPGTAVYGEDLVKHDGQELRRWNPYRSKLAAMLLKEAADIDIKVDSTVLYLGAAAGTTASHVSDIASSGKVFCVEFSERPFRDLIALCEKRSNMIPVLASARRPGDYKHLAEKADIIYQDISQRDQVDIFISNVRMFLKVGGCGILMVKSRSIDVNAQPKLIYNEVRTRLISESLGAPKMALLSPYQKDHAAFVMHFKGQPKFRA